MSRSGYVDDCEDQWALIRWRGAVNSAIRGARGQAMLREVLAALDALPEKSLAAGSLETADGEFCTLGALGRARGMDMAPIDPEDREAVAQAFGIAEALAAEIMHLNDEYIDDWRYIEVEIYGPLRRWESRYQTVRVVDDRAGEKRWQYMRNWVLKKLRAAEPPQAASVERGD